MINIGFIGLNPDSHWAYLAHLPALESLKSKFEIVGVANSTPESGRRTADALGIKYAFATPQELVQSDEIDLVVVSVKVPHHFELISAALKAGKHVHSEWPLANGLEEAKQLTALAKEKGVVATCSTQMRVAPEVLYLKKLIADGYVGEVLSVSLIGSGGNWGAECQEEHLYLYEKANGASMLEIPFAHTLAGVKEVLGDFGKLKGKLIRRRHKVKVIETGEEVMRTDFDQIMVHGELKNGAAFSAHYRGGTSKATNLLCEINGTEGDLQVLGNIGHGQFAELMIKGAQSNSDRLQVLVVPEEYKQGRPAGVFAGNVAGIYAAVADDILNGTRKAPSFEDALRLHEILNEIETIST